MSNGHTATSLIQQPREEDIKELFARFGLAYYHAECLHRDLCNLYAALKIPVQGPATRLRVEEHLRDAFESTLGRIVQLLRPTFPAELLPRLDKAIEQRNLLAHHFWYERAHLMGSVSGVEEMIAELSGFTELFQESDKEVDKLMAPHNARIAYAATGLAVAGIHALMLLRRRNQPFHFRALGIALTVGGIASILQPFTGDVIVRAVARNQPVKLAAFEAHYQTQAAAPLQVAGGLEIPAGLSLLAFHTRDAVVQGLEDFPRDQWPAVRILRPAFLIMVTAGFLAAAVACWAGVQLWWWHKPPAASRWLLWAVVCAAPLGFIAIEAGWTITELGRQPWIVYGFMRTADAVTPMPGLAVPFVGFTLLYLLLATVVAWMLSRHIADAPREAGEEVDAVLR
jgi:bd-type cytochrome oxidase subunit I